MASVVFPSPHVAQAPQEPPSPERPSAVVVKLSLRGETYRVPFETQELTWRALEAKVHDCYGDASRPALWALLYRDDEDDLVTVNNDRELREAIRVFAELKGEPATVTARGDYQLHMHFHVVAKLSLKEQLAPVLHAVTEISEKMARVAADTRASLRKSSYVERGRESLYHSAANTRQALSSAGRGLSQRVRRASTVVVDEISVIPRRLRTRSRFSSQDMREDDASPQTLMATDAAREREDDEDASPSEMDVAELLLRARAEEEAAELAAVEARQDDAEGDSTAEEHAQPLQTDSTPLTSPAVVAAEPEVAEEVGHASDAETASTASEDTHDEWDIVRSSSSPVSRPLSPFFEVEADGQEEVSFTRWETQLTTIRDIMPQIDLGICVDVLEKHNGDLEAALVELTEL